MRDLRQAPALTPPLLATARASDESMKLEPFSDVQVDARHEAPDDVQVDARYEALVYDEQQPQLDDELNDDSAAPPAGDVTQGFPCRHCSFHVRTCSLC